jgi:hypothetical protein
MRRPLLLIIFLTLALFSHPDLYAQRDRRLTDDTELFTGELTRFMGTNLSDQQTVRLTEFSLQWDSLLFSNSEMQMIIKAFNHLIGRNARPYPHLINYIEMLSCFLENDPGRAHYPVWEQAFDDILINNSLSLQKTNDFILGTIQLISNNNLKVTNAATWSGSSGFRYVFDDSLRIDFNLFDLKGFNHIDTLTIYNTSGSLYPLSGIWKGEGGRVTWERAGLAEEEAYATLSSYTIDLNRSDYHADSASFYFNRYISTPISGKLEDRVMTTGKNSEVNYPEFKSYRQEFIIKEIYRMVDYEGGLSMQGAKLIGSGGEQGNARLIFYREGEKLLVAESGHFVFRPQGTSSVSASIVMYFENDSVFHPDLHLNYVENTRELSLNQNQKVISQSPWDNQFHQVDMTFARLLWTIDDNEIRLTMPRAGSIGNANFESLNFFDRNQYQRLQGMDTGHPLLVLRTFSENYGSETFSAEAYARYLRRPVSGVRHQLLELSLQGFIFYDTDTDLVRIRRRLYDYLLANIQRIDYDVINFTSTTNAPQENATIDLGTFDMKINGIPRVFISNSQNVNIYPKDNTVTIKKNRNFLFDGTINAGNLSFFGNNFAFNYDKFTINLQNVDSISLRAQLEEKDMYGRALLTNVKNLINNVTGELQVDKPDNKSSRVHYPDYPRFSSNENSYVFYEKPYIQNNVYSSDNFYYVLYPFVMDSLNTFSNDELRFRGKLISGGIFPDIEELLTLQDDYSLGITHNIAEGGLPAYGGKGKYHHTVKMSNKGLRGSGRYDYMTSSFYSEDFLFMPDSMNAMTHEFLMAKQISGTQFPDARSKNNPINWLPEEDLMSVGQTDSNFQLFDDQAEISGNLFIRPSGLTGEGTVSLDMAEIISASHQFGADSFTSDHSEFTLRGTDANTVSVAATSLGSFIDMKKREGTFTRYPEAGRISFPANSYTGSPETFSWNMDKRQMEFFSTATDPLTGLTGAEYISTEKNQDSIRFISPHILLDYNNDLITASQVKFLNIADATIFPVDETLLISRNAQLAPIEEARLVTQNGDHTYEIYNAGLKIEGRYSYNGSGDYDYLNELAEPQTIHFDSLWVDDNNTTVGSGKIAESENFMLSPRFRFSGKAELVSSRPHLRYSGAVKISEECEGIKDSWLAFENEIDPMEVLIPVPSQPLSEERNNIYSGIFVATDSVHIYPAFFSERKNYADKLILSADGYMRFEPHTGEYRIASLEKLRNPEIPGNYLTFNTEECILAGEGMLDLGISLGQLEIEATGSATNKVDLNETSIKGMISLDFFFSAEAMALMAQNADSLPAMSVDSSSWYFTRGVKELLGNERADQYLKTKQNEDKPAVLPEELNKTIVLSDVSLYWNKLSRSYQSAGEIGIAYIDGHPVNKKYTGYLEITKRRSGDYIDLYIEIEKDNWYYFGYTRGVMQAYSSNPGFTNIIENLALRHRRSSEGGNERYVYMIASDSKLEQFFKTYNNYTQGIEYVPLPDEPVTGEEVITGDTSVLE